MDALELMVDQRHFDQRIEGGNLVIVDEALQPTHGGTDLVLILWRNVNNLSRLIIPHCGAGRLPKPIGASLQKLEHADHRRIHRLLGCAIPSLSPGAGALMVWLSMKPGAWARFALGPFTIQHQGDVVDGAKKHQPYEARQPPIHRLQGGQSFGSIYQPPPVRVV